jgi:hypothetical protein
LLRADTWTSWRTKNRKHVVTMVQAGMSADEIDRAHRDLLGPNGSPYVVMAWLQEAINRRAAADASPHSAERLVRLWNVPRRPTEAQQ